MKALRGGTGREQQAGRQAKSVDVGSSEASTRTDAPDGRSAADWASAWSAGDDEGGGAPV